MIIKKPKRYANGTAYVDVPNTAKTDAMRGDAKYGIDSNNSLKMQAEGGIATAAGTAAFGPLGGAAAGAISGVKQKAINDVNRGATDDFGVYNSKGDQLKDMYAKSMTITGTAENLVDAGKFALGMETSQDKAKQRRDEYNTAVQREKDRAFASSQVGAYDEVADLNKSEVVGRSYAKGTKAVYSKGSKYIEIESKEAPEIHTDKNFNLKNLGTKPHSKGGTKVLADDGDIVFPTQDSKAKFKSVMGAIAKGDVSKLESERSKLPKDGESEVMKFGSKGVKSYAGGTDDIKVPYRYGLPKGKTPYAGGFEDEFGFMNPLKKTNPSTPNASNNLSGTPNSKSGLSPEEIKAKMLLKPTPKEFEERNIGALAKSDFKYNKLPTQDYNESKRLDSGDFTNKDEIGLGEDPTLNLPLDTKDDSKAPKPPTDKYGKYADAAGAAISALPAIYNIAEGTKRPDKTIRREYNPELLNYKDYSAGAQRDSELMARNANYVGNTNAGGSLQNMRANMTSVGNAMRGQKEQIRASEANKLNSVNLTNVGARNTAKEYNIKMNDQADMFDLHNRAATQKYTEKGLTEASKFVANERSLKSARDAQAANKDYLTELTSTEKAKQEYYKGASNPTNVSSGSSTQTQTVKKDKYDQVVSTTSSNKEIKRNPIVYKGRMTKG